jgi:magnesium-transporting ATPase (P-type)
MVFAIGVATGRPVLDMAITAVSLVVAAVPESLPAVVTLALALNAHRMTRANAIARQLPAVETLGSVTTVASDKTGALTEGRMAVRQAVTADGTACAIAGSGYDSAGTVSGGGSAGLVALARAGLLCNDATLTPPDDGNPQWSPVGDPLEAALVTFAARCGLDPRRNVGMQAAARKMAAEGLRAGKPVRPGPHRGTSRARRRPDWAVSVRSGHHGRDPPRQRTGSRPYRLAEDGRSR